MQGTWTNVIRVEKRRKVENTETSEVASTTEREE